MTEVYKFQPPLTAATVEEILQDNYPKIGDPRYLQAEKDKLAALPTAAQLATDLSEKVDKEAGKGLSDTNYTQAEKDKLAGLEGSHYRGQFTSLAALEAAVTTPEPGDYADVDAGAGSTVVRYVWDSNDSIWTAQVGESTQLTGAQIKVMYEAQPDTNAFSDTDKSKLDGVQAGATANSSDAFLLNRANHSGTQPVGTITGLGTAATANVTTSPTDTTAGRLLKVGDFGLGNISGAANLAAPDSFAAGTGIYIASRANFASPPFASGDVYLLHQRAGGSSAKQIALRFGTIDEIAYRSTADGGTTWSPWKYTYHTGNILGTVSQSAGVPTGAIIQRGSNANGEFVRFADGTQICNFRTTITIPSATSLASLSWTFPSGFAAAPKYYGGTRISTDGTVPLEDRVLMTRVGGATSASGASFIFENITQNFTTGNTLVVCITASGHWF